MAFPDPLETSGPSRPVWLPIAILTILVLLSALPLPAGHGPLPDLVLVVLYIACARRPAAISPGTVFILGLLQDLLSSTPFGLHALVFILVHAASSRAAELHKSFLLYWLGFVPVAVVAMAVSWLVIAIHHASFVSLDLILPRTLASILAFPLIVIPYQWIAGVHHDET